MAIWGYSGDKGPEYWSKNFPHASGSRQSPIDIVTSDVTVNTSIEPLAVDYSSATCTEVINTGISFQVNAAASDANLSGGPLLHKYKLGQFHCHWGSKDGQGSEHQVNGKSYDAELHLVHWNAELFQTFSDAMPHDQGLAVLAVFIKVGKEHSDWSKFLAILQKVQSKDEIYSIEEKFDPLLLLPENKKHYWTYEGSLTTPPCYESARFIVYRQPVEISHDQINVLRSLLSCKNDEQPDDGCSVHLGDNFRPTMPLNGRGVIASFEAGVLA